MRSAESFARIPDGVGQLLLGESEQVTMPLDPRAPVLILLHGSPALPFCLQMLVLVLKTFSSTGHGMAMTDQPQRANTTGDQPRSRMDERWAR